MRKALIPMVAVATIGAAGLGLIQSNEGVVYKTYRDPAGIITACYGHTGPELRMGMTFTLAQCQTLLMQDIIKHQRALIGSGNCIRSAPLNQNQLDALTDFTFNVGPMAFCKSTLAAKLRIRDYRSAAYEFPKWRYARVRGKATVLPGLVKRRSEEMCVFGAMGQQALQCLPDGALRAIMAHPK